MHTHAREHNGVGAAAKSVAEHASALVRLELELAALELKRKAGSLAVGIGLLLGAALLGIFLVGFGLAAGAAGIATALPVWAALLVVTGGIGVLVLVLVVLGLRLVSKGAPPVPELAIAEAKKTTEALKADGHD